MNLQTGKENPTNQKEDKRMTKEINKKLSLKGCWNMVNRIQLANTPEQIRERCRIAEEWLTANEVISNEEYNELMKSVTYLNRESYHLQTA